MDLNICILGSSSAGNMTAIWNKKEVILIDCGFNWKYTQTALEKIKLLPEDISHVLITHSHTDHFNPITASKLQQHGTKIWCHEETAPFLLKDAASKNKEILLDTFNDFKFSVDDTKVTPFKLHHDSDGGCVGFSLIIHHNGEDKKITIATDLSVPEKKIIKNFVNSDIIIIEANHDVDMLKHSGRPYWLIKRILKSGHLSNDQCADIVEECLKKSTNPCKAIFLAHTSQQCNTNKKAIDTVKKRILKPRKRHDPEILQIVPTYKSRASRIIKI